MQALAGDGADFDPFAATDCVVMAPTSNNGWGQRVSVETPIDELRARLVGLVKREGRLDAMGVKCPLKDNPEMSCLACPFSKAEQPELEGECQLCRIGVGQEHISTLILAKQAGPCGQG